ncbi:hypothetical protein KM043_000535 [Ampulex compressa]|nr:hypothetical protein KM043_000535 [Ampulex compressa]
MESGGEQGPSEEPEKMGERPHRPPSEKDRKRRDSSEFPRGGGGRAARVSVEGSLDSEEPVAIRATSFSSRNLEHPSRTPESPLVGAPSAQGRPEGRGGWGVERRTSLGALSPKVRGARCPHRSAGEPPIAAIPRAGLGPGASLASAHRSRAAEERARIE